MLLARAANQPLFLCLPHFRVLAEIPGPIECAQVDLDTEVPDTLDRLFDSDLDVHVLPLLYELQFLLILIIICNSLLLSFPMVPECAILLLRVVLLHDIR